MIRSAAVSLAALVFAASPAIAGENSLSVNGLQINAETFFEDLVALDAEDIETMRVDFADALDDIDEAMADIEDARADTEGVPGGRFILRIAFGVASKSIAAASDTAFSEVHDLLDDAETRLDSGVDKLDPAETEETKEAINVLRDGLTDVGEALADLAAAMRD